GSARQRESGLNSLGVILLRAGRPESALDAFRELEKLIQVAVGESSGPESFAYFFNLGTALEQNKQPGVLDAYLKSLEVEPEFQPALDASLRILESEGPSGASGAVRVAEILMRRKTQSVGVWLHRALRRWAGQPDSEELLCLLALHYRDVKLTKREFDEGEW